MKTPQSPIPRLAAALGLKSEVWLKREDRHHLGSHKGRSIPLMINEHHKNGASHFVISSSGNAAIAASRAVVAHNKNKSDDQIDLHIFIGQHISPAKDTLLEAETSPQIIIERVKNPRQRAFQFSIRKNSTLLRQSTDPLALLGYHELALELAKIENLAAIFVPTSSGTTAVGLAEGFEALNLKPEIHIVQTTSIHPMIDDTVPSEKSLADAIVDKIAYRKNSVLEVLKNTGGAGWVATNTEIVEAIDLIKNTAEISISPNSALSVVGLLQAIKKGRSWSGPVVCLITGA